MTTKSLNVGKEKWKMQAINNCLTIFVSSFHRKAANRQTSKCPDAIKANDSAPSHNSLSIGGQVVQSEGLLAPRWRSVRVDFLLEGAAPIGGICGRLLLRLFRGQIVKRRGG